MKCLKLAKFRKLPTVSFLDQLKSQNNFSVRVHYGAINPSDLAFINGTYAFQKHYNFPIVPGFEGAGTIEEAPIGHNSLLGKKVAFLVDSSDPDIRGSWGEVANCSRRNMIVLPDDFPTQEAACLSINALSAIGLLKSAEIKNEAVVLNLGSSSISSILKKLLKKQGCQVLVVQRSFVLIRARRELFRFTG